MFSPVRVRRLLGRGNDGARFTQQRQSDKRKYHQSYTLMSSSLLELFPYDVKNHFYY